MGISLGSVSILRVTGHSNAPEQRARRYWATAAAHPLSPRPPSVEISSSATSEDHCCPPGRVEELHSPCLLACRRSGCRYGDAQH